MKHLLIALVFTIGVLLPTTAKADDPALHFAAHFGMSYAISNITFGIAERAFKANPTDAFIFAMATTLMVGAVYKVLSTGPNYPQAGASFGRAMLYDGLGVAGFGASVVVFSW